MFETYIKPRKRFHKNMKEFCSWVSFLVSHVFSETEKRSESDAQTVFLSRYQALEKVLFARSGASADDDGFPNSWHTVNPVLELRLDIETSQYGLLRQKLGL